MRLSFLHLLLAVILFSSFSHEPLSDWKVSKTEDEIEISYRRILVGDTLETREMRVTFEIQATPDALVAMFRDKDKFMSWSPDVSACTVLAEEGSEWVMHKTYDLPWPISTRDIVTRQSVEETDAKTTLDITGEEGWVEPVEGVKRIPQYEAHWNFYPVSGEMTEVVYTTVELSSRPGPRFVVDGIVEGSYIKSIKRLKEKMHG